MAKFKQTNGLKKIDLEDIEVKENSRKEFTNIDELAGNIEKRGQIQPVAVAEKPEGGYILIAGERRLRAHQLLVSQGKPFNQIEAVVKTGDFFILQLSENINRENLNAAELEAALKSLIDKGMTQSEIAEALNKRIQWVSDTLKAGETREKAEAAGINTESASSSTLSILRNQPPDVIKNAMENGGTTKAARKAKAKAVEPPKDQQHEAFYEGQVLFDDKGRKIAVVISCGGETGTIKEIKE